MFLQSESNNISLLILPGFSIRGINLFYYCLTKSSLQSTTIVCTGSGQFGIETLPWLFYYTFILD